MSVRQYIGARYVTKIYENSLDPSSAEWEGGRYYEPLTLVTYLNSSYLSKKDVPASVGDPASNPSYWVITGAYNGQIATLQAQIDTLQAELASVNHKKIIIITDSYGEAQYGDSGGNAYTELIRQHLGMSSDDFIAISVSTSGFVGETPPLSWETRWQYIVEEHIPDFGDLDDITDIMFIGGANDIEKANLDVANAMESCCNYVKTIMPNAKIHIAHVGIIFDASHFTQRIQHSLPVYRNCSQYGASYINNSEFILMYSSLIRTDKVHPSPAGATLLASQLAQGILTGSCSVAYDNHISGSDIKDSGTLQLYTKQMNNCLSVYGADGGQVIYKKSGSGTWSSSGELAKLDTAPCMGYSFAIPILFVIDGTTVKHGQIVFDQWTGTKISFFYLCFEGSISYTTSLSIFANATFCNDGNALI